MNFHKDYYEVLGVPLTATKRELKRARNELARKYHSDLQKGEPNANHEERMREINEAYEVLSDNYRRQVYDEYKKQEREQEKAASETRTSPRPSMRNQRTVTRKYTETVEKKTFVKGKIRIKYYGPQSERLSYSFLSDTYYRIIPKDVMTWVNEGDFYPVHQAPAEFAEVFAKHKPFDVNLGLPIRCIIRKKGEELPYDLFVNDLTIPEPVFENISKHENETFGTITGTFYGYLKKVEEFEKEEKTTEFYGETGNHQERTDNGTTYRQTEFFHKDGSTFWGPWVSKSKPAAWGSTTYRSRSNGFRTAPIQTATTGCFASFGSLFGYLYLAYIAFFFLRILFGIFFVIGGVATNLVTDNQSSPSEARKPVPPRRTKNPEPVNSADAIINHYLSWTDYDGVAHQGRMWVKQSWFNDAGQFKAGLSIQAVDPDSYDQIVHSLKGNDIQHLQGMYALFDSIRTADHPSEQKFAEIIVSCVQTIPYALILPEACNPALYEDAFTRDYLNGPNALCQGEQRYGINSPVEFLATLKGDCDTRALLLYTLLSHYGYDVALLSSEYFSHSLIGINLPYDGVALDEGLSRYVLWETTAKNVRPGIVPEKVSDTNYWRISLKSSQL